MIKLHDIAGTRIAVMGLGISGLATARALAASGADVLAWDDDEKKRAEAQGAGLPLADLNDTDWTTIPALVLSPGIPHCFPEPHPVAAAAAEAGTEIIGDIELLGRAQRSARYVGITGTNGKSTTTALIGDILRAAGHRIEIGGNLGPPVLGLEPLDANGTYVLEMSSFQLERTRSVIFDVAVLLNISADHLERHGGFEGYVNAKLRILLGQGERSAFIVGVDDDRCRRIYEKYADDGIQRVIPVSSRAPIRGGVYVLDGVLYDDLHDSAEIVADLRTIPTLPGSHNWQNAAAAYAAATALGVERSAIKSALAAFAGLPHRQEVVSVIDGIAYVNDSKATNAEAAGKALDCYPRIYWILGGQAKSEGIEPLRDYFPRIVHAFLIGEASTAFAATLRGEVPLTEAHDLETAVYLAGKMAANDTAAPRAVVLLSPACASYDQFPNFAARGDHFRALVSALPGSRNANAPVKAAGGGA
ncbi:MAG TPA: UDP-N-acetylmuramoyl-L-alanine--D-glutamate ligase [Alphaproteobacteria bacterium]|nr:UDP-N-acetylmuramoyl-L-alanine--D-glutamate ligase [Alphaproteobacteria bacterium]